MWLRRLSLGALSILFYGILGTITNTVAAEVVELAVQPNIVALADYRAGDTDKPALLLLHGFLQTRTFSTILNLANTLHDEGYTVLLPTLSLGINRRSQSLSCEAVHTQTFEEDLDEIDRWIGWLNGKGHKRVIGIGHSSGSVQLLAYTTGKDHKQAFEAVILLSLLGLRPGIGKPLPYPGLKEYSLGYCTRYPATAEAFEGFARYTRVEILKILARLKLPNMIVQGSADLAMGIEWPRLMANRGAHVVTIPGADHFFNSPFEFDLYDRVIEWLDGK